MDTERLALCLNLKAGKSPNLDQIAEAYNILCTYIANNNLACEMFFHVGSCRLVILAKAQDLQNHFYITWEIGDYRDDYWKPPVWRKEVACKSISMPTELAGIVDFSQLKFGDANFSAPHEYIAKLFQHLGIKLGREAS